MNLFIAMYVRKEALMSSQIEGTQATLDDILDPSIDENTNRNVADVVNYIKATEFAISRLKELPLCNRLIRETHAVLMNDARGQEKTPGEFRRSEGDYEQWVRFFLTAIRESADDATQAIDKLVALHEKSVSFIHSMGRSAKTVMRLFDYLEANPIIEIQKTAAALGVSFNTTSGAIKRLCEAGILKQTTKAQRNRTFAYEKYLGILRSGT